MNGGKHLSYPVSDVTRALAVPRICDRPTEGFIETSAGVRTHFRRENTVYVMDLSVKKPLVQLVVRRETFRRTGWTRQVRRMTGGST